MGAIYRTKQGKASTVLVRKVHIHIDDTSRIHHLLQWNKGWSPWNRSVEHATFSWSEAVISACWLVQMWERMKEHPRSPFSVWIQSQRRAIGFLTVTGSEGHSERRSQPNLPHSHCWAAKQFTSSFRNHKAGPLHAKKINGCRVHLTGVILGPGAVNFLLRSPAMTVPTPHHPERVKKSSHTIAHPVLFWPHTHWWRAAPS